MRQFLILLLAILAPAANAQSANARTHYDLARRALLNDDPDAAADHMSEAVKLADKVADYHLWYGKAISQQVMRASMFERMSMAGRAKSEFERAVELDARNVEARDALVDFYSMAPAAMGGGADKVREQTEAISRLNPMRGHLALGRLATRASDGATVEREMNAAIALAPDSVRSYSALASWYASQKDWPKAFVAIDRYIARRPADVYGPYYAGRLSALSGLELDRGERGIRAFIAKPPADVGSMVLSLAYMRLGQVLEKKGKHAEAIAAFDRSIKIDPRNDEAKKARGDT